MADPVLARNDQAAGLRRLLGQDGLTALAVLSGAPGDGKTAVAVNLAAAWQRAGRDVLLLDASRDGHGAAAHLGFDHGTTLAACAGADVLSLDRLLLGQGAGVQVLPLGGGFDAFSRLAEDERVRLDAACGRLEHAADLVLYDDDAAGDAAALPLEVAAADLLLVVTPEAASIKGAYARIKRLNQRFGKRDFHLLVNRVRDAAQAGAVAANLAGAARRFLDVRVNALGSVPDDPRAAQAARLRRPLVDAYPDSPAAAAFRTLAGELSGRCGRAGVASAGRWLQRTLEGVGAGAAGRA